MGFFEYSLAFLLPFRSAIRRAIWMLGFKPGDRVIIVRPGAGRAVAYLPGYVTVEAVEKGRIKAGLAALAMRWRGLNRNIRVRRMNVENLEFSDNCFDQAILGLPLVTMEDPKRVLSEVVRVVKPAGKILLYGHIKKKGWDIRSRESGVFDVSGKGGRTAYERIVAGQSVSLIREVRGRAFGGRRSILLRKDSSPSCPRFSNFFG